MTVGVTYELDGQLFLCLSVKKSGLGIFQLVDEKGKPIRTYTKWGNGDLKIDDDGKRIIFQRTKELKFPHRK